MTEFRDSYRLASVILVDDVGDVIGRLAPLKLSSPWFQEIGELVEVVRREYGLRVTILRLLEVDDSHLPELAVSYLAQADREDIKEGQLLAWAGQLDEQPLRLPYAKPGGPAKELSWAREMLSQQGYGQVVEQEQIRTWNLSSIWKLTTASDTFWLKSLPPFFSHEGRVLELFARESVPEVVAAAEQRVLLRHLPGEDCYEASLEQMLLMVDRLVDLQWRWHNRLDVLFKAGLTDFRSDVLARRIPVVITQHLHELKEEHQARLTTFADTLPARLVQLEDCGIPVTLVHGDYHPGNWHGIGMDLTILDWGDCCVGHPLLDLPALTDRAGEHAVRVTSRWQEAWQARLPCANVKAAIDLVRPIAQARMAVVFQHFLDNIEPSERIFHDSDPVLALEKTAEILADHS